MEKVLFVEEGKAKIAVPPGRVSKSDEVFYNPRMRLCRDLSVISARAFLEKENKEDAVVLDAFAASGIRGIRYMLECPSVAFVYFNDLNPAALRYIKKNIKLNGLDESRTKLMRLDARVAMLKLRNSCDVVDIDPFGSPAKFIDCVAESFPRRGMLGVTATDTAPLVGTYPLACYRKYLATSHRYDGMHEAGMRILIGFIIRVLAKHEKTFNPMLCFAREHFFRIQGVVEKNLKMTDHNLTRMIGYLNLCLNCYHRSMSRDIADRCELCGSEKIKAIGPLWIGELFDEGHVETILTLGDSLRWLSREAITMVSTIKEESKVKGGLIYDTHFICKVKKLRFIPPIEKLVEALKNSGFMASRTHINPRAVRTNANIEEIADVIRKIPP